MTTRLQSPDDGSGLGLAARSGAGLPYRAQRGLSMIEIAVVLVIIAVLVAAVGPGIAQQLRNAQIRNAAESIQLGLLRARSEAISRNQNVRFSLVSDLTGSCAVVSNAGSWVVSLSDPGGQCDSDASLTVEPRIVLKHDARDGNAAAAVSGQQSDFSTAATSVVFTPLGRTDGAADGLRRVALSSAVAPTESRNYRVDISTFGGVRVCEPAVTTADDPRRCP
jgi:type IV fimbrial biogenesis protein FimT